MRIEKIELAGFKSFAERTPFTLHKGITCIVGPNGCGKSNIVDAFRWVLGEQSAKSLRGGKMDDVIFNGSTTKKPKGMSEVALTVSGLNNIGDVSEEDINGSVLVTRRLYRSGDSDYLINRSECRLKDIKDLFLDSGLEVKSYSILEQDRIAGLLDAKPEDRRILIEEVAGVIKYKVRRAEAQLKLESSRLNLQRINDIVTEVKRQINSLDRQAKKAERYKRLSAEMREIELKIAKKEHAFLGESLGKILAEHSRFKEEEMLNRAELSSLESTMEKNRIELIEKEKNLEMLQLKLQEIEKEMAENERLIAISGTERTHLKEYMVKISIQQDEIEQKKAEIDIKQKELALLADKFDAQLKNAEEQIVEQQAIIKQIEDGLIESEQTLEGQRREAFRVSEEASNAKNELSKLLALYEGLERRYASTLKELEESRGMTEEISLSIKDIEDSIVEKTGEMRHLDEKRDALLNEISSRKDEAEKTRGSINKTREELASFISRIESVREMIVDSATREILSEAEALHLIAPIADIFSVDAEYEKAIESSLSEKISGFVVSSFEDIKVIASTLDTKNVGRTALMPLNVPGMSFFSGPDRQEGILGMATDFVRSKDDFGKLAMNLLRNVAVVKDLQTAISLASNQASNQGGVSFVTLAGEVIEPSGAVVVGRGKEVLKRKREIRELEQAVEEKEKNIILFHEAMNRTEQVISEKESEFEGIVSRINETEKNISLSSMSARNYREEKERIGRKLEYLTAEINEIIKEKGIYEKSIEERKEAIYRFEVMRAEVELAMAGIQEKIIRDKARYEEQRSIITDIKLSITSYREKIESISKEEKALSSLHNELIKRKDSLTDEFSSVNSRMAERAEEIREREIGSRALASQADGFKMNISAQKEQLEKEAGDIAVIEQQLKELRRNVDSLTSVISDLDVSKAEHKLRIENIETVIKQQYGAEISSLDIGMLQPEDEGRLEEIKSKVEDMGPVNLAALNEFEELNVRYEFLMKQQEDLNKSIAELEEAIARINATTRKKLKEAFEMLSIKFSEVFTYLFGGGKAELVLTDNDIFEAGLDIIAQPPGKKLQNIHLLSGGEKTLTTISLLFSSFLIKPTPLCILDEADAALDESNTVKFANLIKELSSRIQFIVVTHNRVTMEIADYIYGITMEEPGASKIISMQFA